MPPGFASFPQAPATCCPCSDAVPFTGAPMKRPLRFIEFRNHEVSPLCSPGFCIDSIFVLHYSAPVRWITILIAITLLYNVFVPCTTSSSTPAAGSSAVDTLNECPLSFTESIDHDDAPIAADKYGAPLSFPSFRCNRPAAPLFPQLLIAVQNEHPPKYSVTA